MSKRAAPKFTRQQFAEAIVKLSAQMGGGDAEMHAIVNGCLQCGIAAAVACGAELDPLLDHVRECYRLEKSKVIPKVN